MRAVLAGMGCLVTIAGVVGGCRSKAPEQIAPDPASSVGPQQAVDAKIERPAFRVCVESTGSHQRSSSPLVLRAESISKGYSSSCSRGAVQCRVTADPRSGATGWAIQVDYRVYTDVPWGDPTDRATRLAQACSFDLTRAPAYCVPGPYWGGTESLQIVTERGSWSSSGPLQGKSVEICFGDNLPEEAKE